MCGINEVTLIGRLGQDPKKIQSKNNPEQYFVQCHVATNETCSFEQEIRNHVEWHTIEVSQPLAKFMLNHGHKGDLFYIKGRLRRREWETSEKIKQHQTVIKVDRIQRLSKATIGVSLESVQNANGSQDLKN